MAAFLFFLLLISAVSAQHRYSNVSLGSSLTPTTNSSWLSPSGLYAFGFFPQNNAYAVGVFVAGVSERTVVWVANRDGNLTVPNDAVLQLTQDGKLILQQGHGRPTDVVPSSVPIRSASMLDSGNFVLYDNDSKTIWQSFEHPTDTLLPGQRLLSGWELFSRASESDYSKGKFRLIVQLDGWLVQYPVNTPYSIPYGYYSKGLEGYHSNVTLNLGNDGRLYLSNGSSILLNITPGGGPTARTMYLLRIDVDGLLRIYSHSLRPEQNWTAVWSSTEDKCDPKGFCGFNSFCIPVDNVADCKCLPGFDFVQPGNKTAGCTRNFTSEGCWRKDGRATYVIEREESTVWEDDSYYVLNTITEEDCRQACLDDCNCDAAFYRDGECRKQRLPLRFGRRSRTESNVTLVRVSEFTPDTGVSGNPGNEIKKDLRLEILIIGISLIVVAALVMAISVLYVHRKRGAYKKIVEHREANLIEDVALRAFTYAGLAQATNNFKEELGRGASGTVFRGILPDSQKMVAVKRLEKEFAEGEKEFQTEMKVIGKTYHRNLVRLLGYCLDGLNRLLVFEYMSNGSLADILFKPENKPSWAERNKIARDIARGILYLHEECESQIIHCDVKPQNILMDEQGCAKISDFGLAKLLKQDQTNTHTGIRGTKGYVAPEWHEKQAVTVKADVYSYGIVLLEIICCRRSVDWKLPEEEAVLEEWVYDCYDCYDCYCKKLHICQYTHTSSIY